ncbi:ATP-binding protein [Paenibacillus swuensis]|uniref:ATP-binding protein n=1 Tax=Paenibacillus swuensis TaxID=1178515 RepID=UPI0008387707|nr:ATP-binding protein [Paenibacillus swuensis]
MRLNRALSLLRKAFTGMSPRLRLSLKLAGYGIAALLLFTYLSGMVQGPSTPASDPRVNGTRMQQQNAPKLYYLDKWQMYQGKQPDADTFWQPLDRAAVRSLKSYKGDLWLKRTVPELPLKKPYMMLSGFKHVEVTVGQERIYTYNLDRPYPYVNGGFMQLFVPLDQTDAGQTITVHALWDRGIFREQWNLVGERESMRFSHFHYAWIPLVYGTLLITAGLLGLYLWVRRRKERIYGWLALFGLSAGVGIGLMNTGFLELRYYFDWMYWRDLLLPIGIYAFLGFYGTVLGGNHRLTYLWGKRVLLLFTAFSFILAWVTPYYYNVMMIDGLPWVFVPVFAAVSYTLFRQHRRERSRETVWLTRGYLVLLLSCSIHLTFNAFPHFANGLLLISDVLHNFVIQALAHGLVLFTLCLIMVVFERIADIYRKSAAYAEELAERNEQLARMDRLKDDFLRNTSHELRTPLHGIAGLAESLLNGAAGPVGPKLRTNLHLVLDSADRLLRLVNDILDLYRLKHRDLELQPEPADLRRAVGVVLAALAPLAERKGLSAEAVDIADIYVQADPNRLEQILYNLIGNAIKYTDSGGITVTAAGGERTVAVTVADTGRGIPAERLALLFEPFASADGLEPGSSGLGLSITKRIVELHGGTLTVVSEGPGCGTRVCFTLPAAAEKPAAPAVEAQRERMRFEADAGEGEAVSLLHAGAPLLPLLPQLPLSPGHAEPGETGTVRNSTNSADADIDASASNVASINDSASAPAVSQISTPPAPLILIVDDEPVNVQVLLNYMAGTPYRLIHAANGTEALRMVDSGDVHPDLILLDVMMPGITGYEVCRMLREKYGPNELPVILLSARNRVSDLAEGFDAGANDYLPKPFAQRELLARVHIQLRLAEFQRSLEELVRKRTGELEEANRSLAGSVRETAEALTEVSVLEERNRIAHEIHDVVGHTLTAAIVQMEAAKKLADRNMPQSVEKIAVVQELIRKGLDDIRRSVRLLKDETGAFELAAALRELIRETQTGAGVRIEAYLHPLPPLSGLTQRVLYHALQEGLTNGIRHGQCTQFVFELYAADECIYFKLRNDGESYGDAKPGFGLTAMMERVHLLGGTVDIGSSASMGAMAPTADGADSLSAQQQGCLLALTLPLSGI